MKIEVFAPPVCTVPRLPLRGAGAERLRGVTAPKASRRVSAYAEGACAPPPLRGGTPLRHASRATSPQGEALGVRRLRGVAAPMVSRRVSACAEGRLPRSCVIIPQFPPKQKQPGQSAEIPGRAGGFLDFCRRSDIIKANLPAARQPARRDRRNLKHAEKHRENHGKNRRPV